MAADEPTILATSGGLQPGVRTSWSFSPMSELAVELAEPAGRPRVCFLATACGDAPDVVRNFYNAALESGYEPSHLALFPMPNLPDPRAHLLAQDVIWVFGGSVAGLLALWRLHGLGEILREAWQAGVVLTGVSAGSICWHAGGPTDSFGPELRGITDGLGFLPYGNGVHYDSEEQRRPALHRMVADGTFDRAYATEDGTGLLYRGTELVEAVADKAGKAAYRLERDLAGQVQETALPVRLLG